jgi:hypothetical protein
MCASLKQGIIEAISLRSCTMTDDRGVTVEEAEHDVPSCVPLHPKGIIASRRRKENPQRRHRHYSKGTVYDLIGGQHHTIAESRTSLSHEASSKWDTVRSLQFEACVGPATSPPWLRSDALRLRTRRGMLLIPSVRALDLALALRRVSEVDVSSKALRYTLVLLFDSVKENKMTYDVTELPLC